MPEENSNTPNPSMQNIPVTDTAQPVADPSVQPPVPESSKPRVNKRLVMIIAAILLLLVVGGTAAYFLVFKNQVATPTSTPTPEATATPDPTADWETYTTNEYSFKHPLGLKSDTGAAGRAFESIRFSFMGQKQIASGKIETELSDGYAFTVTKIGSIDTTSPKQEAEKEYSNSKESCPSDNAIVEIIAKTTIDNNEAYRFSVKDCLGDYTLSFVSSDKFVYSIIQLYVGDSEDYSGYKLITDQILSTFKFVE